MTTTAIEPKKNMKGDKESKEHKTYAISPRTITLSNVLFNGVDIISNYTMYIKNILQYMLNLQKICGLKKIERQPKRVAVNVFITR